MLYLLCVVLVVAAVLLVVIGAATASAIPYVGAAILSAVVVALLWRRVRGTRENVFITDPPATTGSQWDRPIRRSTREPVPQGTEIPPVAIAHYDDLVAAEVLPSLETLSVDELATVILRERHGMGRQAIIRRAEVLIDLTLGTGTSQRVTASAPVTTVPRGSQVREREVESPRVAPTQVVPDAPVVRDEPEILPEPPSVQEAPQTERAQLQPDATKSRPKTQKTRAVQPKSKEPKSAEAEGKTEPKAKRQRKSVKKDPPDLSL